MIVPNIEMSASIETCTVYYVEPCVIVVTETGEDHHHIEIDDTTDITPDEIADLLAEEGILVTGPWNIDDATGDFTAPAMFNSLYAS